MEKENLWPAEQNANSAVGPVVRTDRNFSTRGNLLRRLQDFLFCAHPFFAWPDSRSARQIVPVGKPPSRIDH